MTSRRSVLKTAAGLTVGASLGWQTAWAKPPTSSDVWATIVRDATLRWTRLPSSWQDGAFLGNALLGVTVYPGPQARSVKFVLGHNEVVDHRPEYLGAIGFSRLPIGWLELNLAGTITAIDWSLDIWDAELRGTLTTTAGSVSLTARVDNDTSALLVAVRSSAAETPIWSFTGLNGSTTRTTGRPPDYVRNPDPAQGVQGSTHYSAQTLLAGGGYATAWEAVGTGTQQLAGLVIRYSEVGGVPTDEAVAALRTVLATDQDRLVERHRRWWHRFYRASLVSIPDKRLQRFYWIQLYKMASASRRGGSVITEWGSWYPERGFNWPAVWWNLNVEVGTWFVQASNHRDLDAVSTTIDRYRGNFELSVPPQHRNGERWALAHPLDYQCRPGTKTVGTPGVEITDNVGNLTWALHNVYLTYRYHMDRRLLHDVVLPVLERAVNFYLLFLTPGSDGALHLAATRSPEYANASDCTYDLSLLRWALRTLCRHTRHPRWQSTLRRLAPYATNDAEGILIGRSVEAGGPDVRLADSHRHNSHLLWAYPIFEPGWEQLARKTFDHWASMQVRWHGYSLGIAASMAATMRSPEEALGYLRRFVVDREVIDNTELTPNTMYREGNNKALESPFTGANAILDMLAHSGPGVLRVFPATPAAWADASVANLRAEGAFLVDAARSAGATDWVRVHSEAGEFLDLDHGIPGPVRVTDDRGRPLRHRRLDTTRIALPTRRDQTVVVRPAGDPMPGDGPVDVPADGAAAPWGLG